MKGKSLTYKRCEPGVWVEVKEGENIIPNFKLPILLMVVNGTTQYYHGEPETAIFQQYIKDFKVVYFCNPPLVDKFATEISFDDIKGRPIIVTITIEEAHDLMNQLKNKLS